MALVLAGNAGVVVEVESNHRAMRTTARPPDVGSLGAYQIDTVTGTMAAGLSAASPVYSYRWGSANVALIRRVAVAMSSLGTGFTAGVGLFEMLAARSFTASDTGGTGIVPTGNSQKKRTSFGTTVVTDLRQSSTATLTAGTRTLDSQPVAAIMFAVSTATNTVMLQTTNIWSQLDGSVEWPLVLAQNEGFILRATVPATGTWQMRVAVEWTELATF